MKPRESHLFTSESVTMGHPDKMADQISDAILDSLLTHDPYARAAIETLVTTGLCVLSGEVTVHNAKAESALSRAEDTAREIIKSIGYDDSQSGFDYRSCAVIRTLHGQSPDISQGVSREPEKADEQGAGDQGLMFGFACNETQSLMPITIDLSHRLVERLAEAREQGEIKWLRPDGKAQVTVEYRNHQPHALHTIVLSTQHNESVVDPETNNMSEKARRTIAQKIIKQVVDRECPGLWHSGVIIHINPTGRFVIGGPHGDTGLTGRKVVVDTYGGRCSHGGGAFSGKDPSKVDRSAAYMARYIAKNLVAAGLCDLCEVQIAYAIGLAKPVSLLINTDGTGRIPDDEMEAIVRDLFPLTPRGIINHLKLLKPIYRETARHGHFGRSDKNFGWEKTDQVPALKKAAARFL